MKKYFERNRETEKFVYQSALKVDFWFFVGITIYEIGTGYLHFLSGMFLCHEGL